MSRFHIGDRVRLIPFKHRHDGKSPVGVVEGVEWSTICNRKLVKVHWIDMHGTSQHDGRYDPDNLELCEPVRSIRLLESEVSRLTQELEREYERRLQAERKIVKIRHALNS